MPRARRSSTRTEFGLQWACTTECSDGEGGCLTDGRILDGGVVGAITNREAAAWRPEDTVSGHPVRLVKRTVKRSPWELV